VPETISKCPFGLKFGVEIDAAQVCIVCPDQSWKACAMEYGRLQNKHGHEREEILNGPEKVGWLDDALKMSYDEWQSYKQEQYKHIAGMVAELQKNISAILNRIDKAERLRNKSGNS
jgi:hypothetical protein